MKQEKISAKKTLTNIFKVALSNIFKVLSGVLVAFLLPKVIGVTDYGYYKTFTLYATYVGLFAFGITDGIYLKYGGKSYEELEKSDFRYFTTIYFIIEFVSSLLIAIISIFSLSGELRFIFICLAAFLLTNNIVGYYQIISQITGRFNELAIRNIIQSVLTAIAVVVLWLLHKFADTPVTYRIYTLIYVIINVMLTLWYIFTYRDITFGKQHRDKNKVIWSFIKLGTPLLIANLCSSFILAIDRQFVNILFDTDTYAVYAFAYNMLALITTAMSAISTVIYPTLRRTDESTLKHNYKFLIESILIFVFACLIVYFPLCWFVDWFLPKYTDSLVIFRIILPGLAVSSAITIVMHNYYKTFGKETSFFVKSIIILILSGIANYVAYIIFKTTIAISIASIIVMIIWYVLIEEYFIRVHKVNWVKNFLYMLIMAAAFYLVSWLEIWWAAMLIYLVGFIGITYAFYWKDVNKTIRKIFGKNHGNSGGKNSMPKKILVTGGTGFIGNCFCKLLLKERPDWKIVNVDCLTYAANPSTMEEELKNPNYKFYKADIRDRVRINEIFEAEHPDVVVNFAAESHVDRSITNPQIFLETNILGTAVLMDACRLYGVERYHQVSTDEVYGDLPLDRPDLLFHEDTPLHTSSPYSTSKASADLLVLAYYRTYGLPVTISRCSNNYGPYQFPEKLIPLMINNALSDKPLPVYGKGLNVRDWLYVEDHCRGILAVLEKGRIGEVYNLGGHNEKANIEIVKIILSELGKPESLINHVGDRHGHDLRYAIDTEKANRELGWLPTTMFADGIKLTIDWYLSDVGKKWTAECTSGEYENWIEKNYTDRN